MARRARFTLRLALFAGLVANGVLLIMGGPILDVFGPGYAQNAEPLLHILALGVFPLIIKDHYVAVSRISGNLSSASLLVGSSA